MNKNALKEISPDCLSAARNMAHAAVQLATRAARANLKAEPDDSQSNLSWDEGRGAFMSHPLVGGNRQSLLVGVSLRDMALVLVSDNQELASVSLSNVEVGEAEKWLDTQLETRRLSPMSAIAVPYDLPAEAADINTYSSEGLQSGLNALSSWFSLANTVFADLVTRHSSLKPGPGAVRCWPHHFDIATYVSLETGDPETARGIGVGMSPGDEGYEQPYFYVNPWPHLAADDLPAAPSPGHWHTQGYVGAIATAEELLAQTDVGISAAGFISEAFTIGLNRLGFEA